MNYEQAIEYMYNRLPMFHRVGQAAYKADLHNTIALCKHLGNPERLFRTIHVAGTNGKGSVSHLLAAILQSAGYRTGLYTSPHLKSFTERIRINGEAIPPDEVVRFIEANQPFLNELQPSFFEMTVGMAFDYFARQQVDIAVIEVGLGGRLDSTNVINPLLSIITNISLDHQNILGDTLPQIASEKAGIIKQQVPVIISEYQVEVARVFEEKAQTEKAPLYLASNTYHVVRTGYENVHMRVDIYKGGDLYLADVICALAGDYQPKNLAGVMQAIDILWQQGFVIDETAIRKGVEEVTTLTGLKGRWQVIRQKPLVICDTGHNEAGIAYVVNQISKISFDTLYFIIGVVNDKDIQRVLALLPQNAYYYFCQATIPRALPADQLQKAAMKVGLQGEVVPDVNEAMAKAMDKATSNDLIFIGGSTFVVAELHEL